MNRTATARLILPSRLRSSLPPVAAVLVPRAVPAARRPPAAARHRKFVPLRSLADRIQARAAAPTGAASARGARSTVKRPQGAERAPQTVGEARGLWSRCGSFGVSGCRVVLTGRAGRVDASSRACCVSSFGVVLAGRAGRVDEVGHADHPAPVDRRGRVEAVGRRRPPVRTSVSTSSTADDRPRPVGTHRPHARPSDRTTTTRLLATHSRSNSPVDMYRSPESQ